jgi:transglutaminase-like putative cysteine protease
MRVRPYSRILRLVSCGTLFFFCWVYLSLFEIPAAYAAEKAGEAKAQKAEKQGPGSGVQGPGERFEKTIEAVREHINKVEEKSRKGKEPSDEITAIKARKTEIESLGAELKNEFAATEKKLKDAKLPREILNRHAKFVEHYQNNLKELIANLEQVERAHTKAEIEVKVKKAKAHLDRVKKPSTHKKLDPNKLPHRLVKARERAPRLKKEQFEKDFPPQRSPRSPRTAWNPPASPFAKGGQEGDLISAANPRELSRIKHKTILLALNEIASDVPFQLPLPSGERTEVRGGIDPTFFTSTLQHFDTSTPFLLAQAAQDLPSADDLSETPEIQFTDAIRAKAQELGNNPVKIYEWVRNNIEYAPTYGSIQGADQCLQSKICNDMDTASLLISLLRVSGIYSHYEYSTIEIPIEKAMNWVGGVTDPKMAGTILATNGIPAKVLISGGTIKAVQLEHIYVKAWIDYIPSRGAVHKQGDTWIPLDPSYKQYTYTQGIDIQTAVPFDAQTFANQIQSTATINPDGSVTNLNSALIQQAMQDYQTRVQDYITQNKPNATVGDVIGKKDIIKQEFGILPETLPYKRILLGSEFAQVPDNLRETMSFNIPDQTGIGTGLSYNTSLPQIAGKKITLSFSPATANDQKVIESLLPKPHADNTPIQPSELPSSFPAYLINLKPELRIDGQVVATGASATMGSAQSFTMSLNEPGIGLSNIDNIIQAGEYFGIGIDTGRIGASRLDALKAKLEATKAKIGAQIYDGLTKDDVVGDLFYATIAAYFAELDINDEITAKVRNVVRYRAPSIGMFSSSLDVQELFGMPKSAGPKGMMMDVDHIMQAVFSKDGNTDQVMQYMIASGSVSSTLEHVVPEQLYSTAAAPAQGVSAVKALQIASNQGIPIYTINQSNIAVLLPQLQVAADVKTDIANAVNAGKQVTVSKTNITFNGSSICGYIISDPVTGAGAYMISGGQSGAFIAALLGGIAAILGIIFGGSVLALTAVIVGLVVFLLGVLNILVNYTQQQWQQFGCYFVMFFVLGLSYPVAGLLSASLLRFLWMLNFAYVVDSVANTNFINCTNQQ